MYTVKTLFFYEKCAQRICDILAGVLSTLQCMIPVTGLLQSTVPGSGDHPLMPQVEVLTSLSPLQVKESMDPPIVTGGVLMMVTPAAVDGVGHTTVLQEGAIVYQCRKNLKSTN